MSLKVLIGPEHAPIEPLQDRTVAVLGYGNQGAAHALNLRDSGVDVVVGARRTSRGFDGARRDGFDPVSIGDAAAAGDLVIVALPDEVQPSVWTDVIAPALRPDATAGFLHGFSVRYDLLRPADDVGVVLVAPKGPGATLRARYAEGRGIPCLFAVHRDSSRGDAEAFGLAWAHGIGCARAAIVYTTFADETETDLFGEQAVLCGGMTALVRAAFETLVAAGYPPELAYVECCHEVKQVADLVYERGLAGMMDAISNTAEFGAYDAIPKLDTPELRTTLATILTSIRNGTFAHDLTSDHANGSRTMTHHRTELANAEIETAGHTVRKWMNQSD